MADTRSHLARWREAGLLDQATVDSIVAYEQGPVAVKTRDERPGVLEALLYLGLIIASGGVIGFVGDNWRDLESWARVAVVVVPAVLAFAAGLGLRFTSDYPLQRGGQVAWLVALALLAGTIVVINEEYGPGADDRAGLLIAGLVTLTVASALWGMSPNHPQVAGLAGASAFFSMSVGNWPDEFNSHLAGLVMVLLGGLLVASVEFERMRPVVTARFAFAVVAAVGGLFLQVENEGYLEWVPFAVGGALIALSVSRASFTYMLVGVAVVFFGLMFLLSEHFQGLGPLAFILAGGLIVAAVLILAQSRPYLHRKRLA